VDECSGVWCHSSFAAVGVGEPATVLVLYYVEYVQAHVTKTLTKNVLDGGLICGMRKCATSLATLLPPFNPDTVFSLLIFKELLPHLLPLHGDHLHSLHKRGNYDPIWGHANHHATVASFPQPPHLPPPLPALAGTSKVMFFSSFFVSFLTIAETSFPHMLGSQTPHLSTVPCPSSLQVPLPPLPHSQACK